VKPLDTVLQFLAGEIEPSTFVEALYNDGELEKFLRDNSVSWKEAIGKEIGNAGADLYEDAYDYLIQLDFSRLGGILNSFQPLEIFLQIKGITYTSVCERYSELYRLMLDSQPAYIDSDANINSEFFQKHILPIVNAEITKAEKKKQIREKYKEAYIYQSKPPRWIQGSEWIEKDGVPLFFVGHLELKHEALHETFHDDGAVYIFLDTETGKIETVEQFY
jgi:hypothetical protein